MLVVEEKGGNKEANVHVHISLVVQKHLQDHDRREGKTSFTGIRRRGFEGGGGTNEFLFSCTGRLGKTKGTRGGKLFTK